MTVLRDWRTALRAAALGLLLVALALPPFQVNRAVYDVVAVLDITGSMNVRDQRLDGAPVSRIAMERAAMARLLADLPCGSRLGLAIFVERQPFLLFEPVETCGNFSALDAEIGAIDWRMGWDSESHIAEGLLAALQTARGLGADLLFLTDGQETPPQSWEAAPDFSRIRGAVRGLVVGVGDRRFSPIPKFDLYGREIGVFRPGEVPSEQAGLFRGREHLSAVDEPHLRSLAAATNLQYRHLDGPGDLFSAYQNAASPRVHAIEHELGWIPASAALLLLLAAMLPRPRRMAVRGTVSWPGLVMARFRT